MVEVMHVGRVARPAEDAVLNTLRVELEPLGFRYKARRLIKNVDPTTIVVQIYRDRWATPDAEVFNVLTEFEVTCQTCAGGDEKSQLLLYLTEAVGQRFHYGDEIPGQVRPIEPDAVMRDFRRYILPVLLQYESPEVLSERLLTDEIVSGVPNRFDAFERIREAYYMALCVGHKQVVDRTVSALSEMATNGPDKDAALFMCQSLGIAAPPTVSPRPSRPHS